MMTDTSSIENGVRPFTGRHMLMVVVAFFGVIIAANMTLAWFAGTTWTGLIVSNGYVASQEYNEVLAEARRQDAAGYRDRIVERDGGFALDLRGPDGAPLKDLTVEARVGRPSHEGLDRTMVLEPVAGSDEYVGRYEFDTGHWTIAVTARDDDRVVFRKNYRLTVAGPVR